MLHDGPPYANGEPHLGHAVNKILKDIFLRYNLMQGKRVNFVPGWDCHGLPIELKVRSVVDAPDALQLRRSAAAFAEQTMQSQRQHFKSWAVVGDWDRPYLTCSRAYVVNELQILQHLLRQGLVFRGHMPVFWSTEYETALAEAELEYKEDHVSHSAFVKFPILHSSLPSITDLHALTWTTMPWTLPSNEAICFAPNAAYSVVQLLSSSCNGSALVVATARLPALEQELGPFRVIVSDFPSDDMATWRYLHPRGCELPRPFIASHYVTMDKGSGLMHTAPNHGKEDHVIAVQHGITVRPSIVNEKGLFNELADPLLRGKQVLTDGNEAVLSLWSANVVQRAMTQHSYPFDWRSKKPVITRPSYQWFCNTLRLREACHRALDRVSVQPPAFKKILSSLIDGRPHWCISRQRAWGVPIPAFYHESDKQCSQPVLDEDVMSNVIATIKERGADAWWSLAAEQLLPHNLKGQHLVKGRDILDIWFDSGVSWSSVLPRDRRADLCLEGVDQMRGWFLSSLITSVAMNRSAPYKSLFVHGFTLDSKGRKMSKSVGNVIHPLDLVKGNQEAGIPALGVDVMRWWVFREASSHTNCLVSLKDLQSCKEQVYRVRHIIKFLLGCLNEWQPECDLLPHEQLLVSDQLVLAQCYDRFKSWQQLLAQSDLKALQQDLYEYLEQLSNLYFVSVKTRLYCYQRLSLERLSAQTTFWFLLRVISQFIAPILPVCMEQAYQQFPGQRHDESIFQQPWLNAPEEWRSEEALQLLQLVLAIRRRLHQSFPSAKTLKECDVLLTSQEDRTAKLMQRLTAVEWADLLQVSSVRHDVARCESAWLPTDDGLAVGVEARRGRQAVCARCHNCRSSAPGELCRLCSGVLQSQ